MAEQQALPAGRQALPAGRRAVLAAAGGACAAALAGCSAYNANNEGIAGPPPSAAATGSAAPPGDASGASGPSGATAADVLASTSQIPVGGGTVLTAKKIVITQPAAGTFHAFTAICTHRSCLVDAVSGGTIDCPCHGSKFSATDGSVVNGPAPSPLAPVAISIQGTSIVESSAA